MAGTALSWKTTDIAQNAGQLWSGIPVPGAGARLTLAADGTPDATANPAAKHLGATTAGTKLMAKATYTSYNVDEFRAPIATNIDAVEMAISANLVGVTDLELMEILTPGLGTYSTASGYKQLTMGARAIVYTGIAFIFPLISDPTKYGVWHLYKALNTTGLEFTAARKELGSTPVSFTGYEITTRSAVDTIGSYWMQSA